LYYDGRSLATARFDMLSNSEVVTAATHSSLELVFHCHTRGAMQWWPVADKLYYDGRSLATARFDMLSNSEGVTAATHSSLELVLYCHTRGAAIFVSPRPYKFGDG
jgi:hypothetical protein